MIIGKRQRVENLREIWPRETDFSDWLATEDGLALLAEDIGIEIEEPRRECRPGDFPCDIVGRKVGDENHVVVIENQFGKTNHDHLGKLLTYAAMNVATTCIWLSETVSDDHRQAIDWLNGNTPPHISFYLAEIKAYRIGDSAVAPQLDVISRPNLEVKTQRKSDEVEQRDIEVWRKEFWQEILEYINQHKPPFRTQRPGFDHWSVITLGRSGFHIGLLLNTRDKRVGCEFVLAPTWKTQAFNQLLSEQAVINSELGSQLQWLPLPDKKRARILLEADIDPKNPANRLEVKEWMYQEALAFYRTFQPRVQQLQEPLTATLSQDEQENESDREGLI